MSDESMHPHELYAAACAREGCEPVAALVNALESTGMVPIELNLSNEPLGKSGGAALAELLFEDRSMTVLKLESTELYDQGFQAVCQSLERHPSVFRLDAGYNGLRSTKPLARLLELSTSLLCVDVSGNSLGPSLLGWSPLAPLAEALGSERCRLQLLQLGNSDIGARGIEALADGLRGHTSVRHLVLDENKLSPRAAPPLARLLSTNNSLTSLDLRYNALADAGVSALAPALTSNGTLGCLVLWGNKISAPGACALAAAVSTNSALEVLDVGSNTLGFEGAAAFKEALGANAKLHTLGLASCALGPEGIIAVAEALEGNPRVRRLDLRRNEIGLAGLMALAAAVKNNDRLQDLLLDAPDAASAAAGTDATSSVADGDGADAPVAPMADEEVAMRAQFAHVIAEQCTANTRAAGGAAAPRSLQRPTPPVARMPAAAPPGPTPSQPQPQPQPGDSDGSGASGPSSGSGGALDKHVYVALRAVAADRVVVCVQCNSLAVQQQQT